MDIAKAEGADAQRELLRAYETTEINQTSLRAIKRILEHRQCWGKNRAGGRTMPRRKFTSAESLVNAYRRESQRQKLMVKKAQICDAKLLFLANAFKKLVADENFVTLLRAESLASMPKCLVEKIKKQEQK
jgi:ParB family chromosome partitioning protein